MFRVLQRFPSNIGCFEIANNWHFKNTKYLPAAFNTVPFVRIEIARAQTEQALHN